MSVMRAEPALSRSKDLFTGAEAYNRIRRKAKEKCVSEILVAQQAVVNHHLSNGQLRSLVFYIITNHKTLGRQGLNIARGINNAFPEVRKELDKHLPVHSREALEKRSDALSVITRPLTALQL